MRPAPARLPILILTGLIVLFLSACQTTTIKKIFVNDEPLFEYPHIVESDRIWIEDDPEVFYDFVRGLKDFLYEDSEASRFFVKRDNSVFMLWLIPIDQEGSTIYELRIEEPKLAYGETVAGGGWIKQSYEFPFPIHLLDGVTEYETGMLPVAFEALVTFYGFVKSAAVRSHLEWIEIDVGNALVLLQKQDDKVSIRFVDNLVVDDAAASMKSLDLSLFVLEEAWRFEGIVNEIPAYSEATPDEAALLEQLILLQGAAKLDEAVCGLPLIPSHRIEWTNAGASLTLRYSLAEGGPFATLTYQADTEPSMSLTFAVEDVKTILEAIDALLPSPIS
jgi:hypothetical protein